MSDEFGMLDKLRAETAGDHAAYVALLERELIERLRVNLGLVAENTELKRARSTAAAAMEVAARLREPTT